MQFIYTIPLFLLFVLILIPSLIVGLSGVWLVRRYNWMLDPEDNDTAALAHAFVGVLYAVALGLIVVGESNAGNGRALCRPTLWRNKRQNRASAKSINELTSLYNYEERSSLFQGDAKV